MNLANFSKKNCVELGSYHYVTTVIGLFPLPTSAAVIAI